MPLKYKKKAITRKPKTVEIDIISREGQPEVTYPVKVLKNQDVPERPVSSSWVGSLAFDKEESVATMKTHSGNNYDIKMPMSVFAGWYYAHSKGTYFNKNIRGKYPVRRS